MPRRLARGFGTYGVVFGRGRLKPQLVTATTFKVLCALTELARYDRPMPTDIPQEVRDRTADEATNYTAPTDPELGAQLAADVRSAAHAAHVAVEQNDYDSFELALHALLDEVVLYDHNLLRRSWYGPTTYGRLLELGETVGDIDADNAVEEKGTLKAAAGWAYWHAIAALATEYQNQFDADSL